MAWFKKVDDDVRKCEREKAERAGRGNDAGSPSHIKGEDVLAESTCRAPSTNFQGSPNKPL